MLAVAVGNESRWGRIRDKLDAETKDTPLQVLPSPPSLPPSLTPSLTHSLPHSLTPSPLFVFGGASPLTDNFFDGLPLPMPGQEKLDDMANFIGYGTNSIVSVSCLRPPHSW
jgi:hypothetical protein